jgi:hypothetical protein
MAYLFFNEKQTPPQKKGEFPEEVPGCVRRRLCVYVIYILIYYLLSLCLAQCFLHPGTTPLLRPSADFSLKIHKLLILKGYRSKKRF